MKKVNANSSPEPAIAKMEPTPFETDKTPTPDIALSGATVDQLMQLLNNPVVFARTVAGTLHGFVDPVPVVTILRDAVTAQMSRGEEKPN